MAEVFLTHRQCQKGGTPNICIICGQRPAEPFSASFRVFSHFSGRYKVFKVRNAWVPLCSSHRGHFRRPLWIVLGGFGLFGIGAFLLFIATAVLMIYVQSPLIPLCFTTPLVLLFFVGLVAALIMASRGQLIATDFTERGMHLTNASDQFAEAVEKDCRNREDDDEEEDEDDDVDDEDDDDGEEDRRRKRSRKRRRKRSRRREEDDEDDDDDLRSSRR